jgi:type II secretory pathway component PulJ
MTLIELMVGTAVSSLLAVGVASLIFYTGRSFAAMGNYVILDNQSRLALDKMSREIRQANKVTEATSTSLTFEDSDGQPLKFQYDASAKTLTRIKNGVADDEPLLKDCTFLEFSIFQRNPPNGSYDEYYVATPATCKLVQLRWVCRKDTLGTVYQTESVQSAKVVIRKQ